MKLVIAEKPDMGKKIASVLGCTRRGDGYMEGGGWCVTWCFGHMVEIVAEEAAGNWSLDRLPILPETFTLRPINEKKEAVKGRRTREEQIEIIRSLIGRCDGVVEATDAGREGELIFRNLYEYLGQRRPFERLWLNALEPEPIAEAFEDLRPGSEYDNLYSAAKQREIADWLVGINATRAMTLAVGRRGGPLSLGRVQTPTLALICQRYIEHKTFRSVPYWYLQGGSEKLGRPFVWRSVDRYDQRQPAERDMQAVLREGFVTVEGVDTQRKTEAPPRLHDLACLQKEANARYRFSMEYTLDIAQALYMKGLITYPRTESRYIPEIVFDKMNARLARHAGDPQYGNFAAALSESRLNRRSVDDSKVTDHHALLVTDTVPREMEEDERLIYGLILARMIESFSPVCVSDVTKVTFVSAGARFVSRYRKDVSPGWRAVMRGGGDAGVESDDVDDVEMVMDPLPPMSAGERIPVASLEMVEDQTRPKPLYSDATLLTAMENAGNSSDVKEVAEALKGVGIGTAATRHEIKKTLISRKYIEVKNNRLLPTKLGMHVYYAVREKSISGVELTARWETALAHISDGTRDAEDFGRRIRRYTERITAEIIAGGDEFRRLREFVAETDGAVICPRCKGGELHFGEKSAYCYKCRFAIWRKQYGKVLSDDSLRALATKGLTPLLTGFVSSRTGRKYDAHLRLRTDERGIPDGDVELELPQKKNSHK